MRRTKKICGSAVAADISVIARKDAEAQRGFLCVMASLREY